jgi:hypothetical protein
MQLYEYQYTCNILLLFLVRWAITTRKYVLNMTVRMILQL